MIFTPVIEIVSTILGLIGYSQQNLWGALESTLFIDDVKNLFQNANYLLGDGTVLTVFSVVSGTFIVVLTRKLIRMISGH